MRKVVRSSLVQRILHASSPQACCSPRLQTPPSLSIRGELICVGAHVLWNGKGQQFIYCLCFINWRRGSISICLYFVEWKLVVQFLYRAIELMFLGIMVGSWPLFAVCWNIILISMNRLMFLNRFLTPYPAWTGGSLVVVSRLMACHLSRWVGFQKPPEMP